MNPQIAFIFPGQGSQKVGMGEEVSAQVGAADAVWALANATLGYDLQALCFDGPAEHLQNTLHAQPALLTVGYLHFLRACEAGRAVDMVAGHSLGEYTALVAAGALEFADALRLVGRRAELMSRAPEGAMAALIGLLYDKLEAVLAEAGGAGVVVAANFNSPGQVVVSGEVGAVEAAMKIAKASGAKLAVRLPVSGAFHSPLMAEAGAAMAELILDSPNDERRSLEPNRRNHDRRWRSAIRGVGARSRAHRVGQADRQRSGGGKRVNIVCQPNVSGVEVELFFFGDGASPYV